MPIAASDGASSARGMIGIARCGVIPVGHDGRSISVQAVVVNGAQAAIGEFDTLNSGSSDLP